MQNDFTTKLLDLKGVIVEKVENFEKEIYVYVNIPVSMHVCPCCNNKTNYVHDYRTQKIKDVNIHNKKTYIIYKRRRYVCKNCNKKFSEENFIVSKFCRTTSRLSSFVIDRLREACSMKSVAKDYNISSTTVARWFDNVSYKLYKLPKVISIDEFKGNADGNKYQCSIVDPVERKVIDILPNRFQHTLISYFCSFKESRKNVDMVIIDLWNVYKDVVYQIFPNAKIVADKYHYTRQNIWAIENIRKRIQKSLPSHLRKYFKRSKKLILARLDNLDIDSRRELDYMLSLSIELQNAHILKELFFKFSESKHSIEAKETLEELLKYIKNANIYEYNKLGNTLRNWEKEILNSFDTPYTNGCIEGYNNKIKVFKRIAYGVRNFKRFRARILHCCS